MTAHNEIPMSKNTILVIDDEPDLVELVRYNLVRDGFEVACASDGRAGLQSARYHKPDLVVLDVMMPNIDGLEVCRQLRADSRTSDVHITSLRRKLGKGAWQIQTVRGFGYRLADRADEMVSS